MSQYGGLILKDKEGNDTGKVWQSDLTNADLTTVNLTNTNMRDAKIEGADFTDGIFINTDLNGCKIELATLDNATMKSVKLKAGSKPKAKPAPMRAAG